MIVNIVLKIDFVNYNLKKYLTETYLVSKQMHLLENTIKL
jgi:hypothetical protein